MPKYNITAEKKIKNPRYIDLVSPKQAFEISNTILQKVAIEKRYRDPSFTARALAKELNLNPRVISASMSRGFGKNFPQLLNEYRIREAQTLLQNPENDGKTVEQIGEMVGFANRQSFYTAFYRFLNQTPAHYRREHSKKSAR